MAKADQIGSVKMGVEADIDGLKDDLKKGEAVTRSSAAKMAANFKGVASAAKSMKGAISGAVAAFAGGLMIGKLKSMAQETIRSANDLGDFAQKLGISAAALQEFQFAAGQVGVKVETLNMGLQRFGRRAAEAANGTGEALSAIQTLGIQLRDSNGQLRSTEALFVDAMNALGGIDNQLDKVRLGFKLFDSEGVALVNMAGNLDELREEARSLGLVLGDDLIARADELQDTFDALAQVTKVQLSPALIDLGGNALEFLAERTAAASTAFNQFYRSVRDVEDLDLENFKLLSKELERQIELAQLAEKIEGRSLGQMLGFFDDSDDLAARKKAVDARLKLIKEERDALQAAGMDPSDSAPSAATGLDDDKIETLYSKLEAARLKNLGREREALVFAHEEQNKFIQKNVQNKMKQWSLLEAAEKAHIAELAAFDKEAQEERLKEEADATKARKTLLRSIRIEALESNDQLIEAQRLRLAENIASLDEMKLNEEEYSQAVLDLTQSTNNKILDIQQRRADEAAKKLKEERKDWDGLYDFMENGFSDAMASMLLDGEFTFKSLAESFAREFIQMGINKTVMPMLQDGLGSVLKGIGNFFRGGPDTTNMGLLDLPGMDPSFPTAANGGPISGPTLVGERGPELFIPGTSGFVANNLALQKMGRGGGGGVNVTVINNSGEKATTTERDGPNGMKEIEVMIGKSVSKSIARGGDVDKAIRNSYGIQRVGRHGL